MWSHLLTVQMKNNSQLVVNLLSFIATPISCIVLKINAWFFFPENFVIYKDNKGLQS